VESEVSPPIMQHSIVEIAKERQRHSLVTTINMRSELELAFMCKATTDEFLKSGRFLLFEGDSSGNCDDTPVMSLTTSLSGLTYKLWGGADRNSCIAVIRFTPSLSSSLPIHFTLSLPALASPSPSLLSSLIPVGCISYAALDQSHETPSTASLSQDDGSYITRRPLYNTETQCYLQNLGSRVKRQSPLNFCVIKRNDGTRSKMEDLQKIIMRFGGLLSDKQWVCDFRSGAEYPGLDKMVALAVVCAVLTEKTLCNLGSAF